MTGMSPIVKTVTRWVKVFIFLYGVYIIITGHVAPGGGFAGGVIIACSYMLLTLAYGREFAFSRLDTRLAGHLDGPAGFGQSVKGVAQVLWQLALGFVCQTHNP